MRNGRDVGMPREETGQEDKGMKPPSEVTPEEDITAAQVVPHITPETATETRHIGALTDDTVETDASTGRNIIVAIGINEYQHQPPLDNPINDAQAVLSAVQAVRLPGTAGRSVADCQRCDALRHRRRCPNNWHRAHRG